MPSGRPKIHDTPEKRAAAIKAYRKTAKTNIKNISVDADMVDLLNQKADSLADEFGFRPTISQTLRYLLKKS